MDAQGPYQYQTWVTEAKMVCLLCADQLACSIHVLYGTTYSDYALIWVSTPPFFEDEDILQKSGRVVRILFQFHIVTREPIFELQL